MFWDSAVAFFSRERFYVGLWECVLNINRENVFLKWYFGDRFAFCLRILLGCDFYLRPENAVKYQCLSKSPMSRSARGRNMEHEKGRISDISTVNLIVRSGFIEGVDLNFAE